MMRKALLCLLGVLSLVGIADAGFVVLRPAPLVRGKPGGALGLYVHAGSEATSVGPSGSAHGACVYWSNPIRTRNGDKARSYLRAPCSWDRDGTLLARGQLQPIGERDAFTSAMRGYFLSDGDHVVFDLGMDNTEVGRRLSTSQGWLLR